MSELVPEFSPGDKVWPREGPMVLQHAPQTVIATYWHPVAGDWLWLDDGQCGFRSFAAAHWTTEEPDEAEQEVREDRSRVHVAAQLAREAIVGIEDPRPLSRERPSSRAALKRALWCRWFHRWRWPRGGKPPSVTSACGGQSLTLSAGPGRDFCDACDGFDYGRAHRRWLAS